MHPNRIFHEHDPAILAKTAQAHAFALVISAREDRPFAAHTPVLLDLEGAVPRLRFHLANHNPATAALREAGRGLVVFTGPHAYISADWYGQEDQVPTWNYLSVEAEGPVTAMDPEALTVLLDDIAAKYEAGLAPKPAWTREKMDQQKFKQMLTAITGFVLTAERFEGIRKLNQNKPVEARKRVIAALEEDPEGLAIASEMHRLEP